jgi:hypothetical protein
VVWVVAAACALVLAVGALVTALEVDQDNAVVSFLVDAASALAFGRYVEMTGRGAAARSALVSWSIAAVGYLVAGTVLDRIIRPRPRR